MKELTKEQYELLSVKYNKYMISAENGVALGLTTDDAKEVYAIYNELYGKRESNYTCASCRINVFTGLYRKFVEYQNTHKKTRKSNGKKDK